MKTMFLTVLAICAFSTANSQQLSGLDVMKENDKQFGYQTEVSTMTMELINSLGKKRSRTVERYIKKDKNDNNRMLIRFLEPADVKGSGFLSIEHNTNDESRYLYLPALKKARRISAGEDGDSFMGTDFTYEDIDEMDFDLYSYKMLGNETVDNTDCYKVEVVPTDEKHKKNSGYSKRIYYVSKNTFVVYQVNYYDKHGAMFKQLVGTSIKPVDNSGKYIRAYTLTMKNLKTNHQTVLQYKDFKINTNISDEMFSIRYLERAN